MPDIAVALIVAKFRIANVVKLFNIFKQISIDS